MTNSKEIIIMKLRNYIIQKFNNFKTLNLKNITAIAFKDHILSQLSTVDAEIEGYRSNELEWQRDLSIKYHWGHNHDFGTFRLDGRMGDRHIDLLANFITFFPIDITDFRDKNIFDIGCWTGGTTLTLAALGGKVHATEEVKKYASTVDFLIRSFGLESHVSIENKSIYECNSLDYHDRFDIVYFPGVIYHLSDPVLSLRILFNSLSIGGVLLVESAGIDHEEPYCRFDGNFVYHTGTREELNRGGWNWFLPSPSALGRMMKEAGFDEIETIWDEGSKRVYGYGKKTKEVGICKAGLSVSDIK
ncbi:MAG: DUF1698 domain-containing protein [Rhodobiaceae bacterium]|nr:DUF1698 domain-containing protein [Rhodobiaceae bacterium]MCC0048142.1 DUF1698 domain-containing protein [Rhodobiaceae bacterium]